METLQFETEDEMKMEVLSQATVTTKIQNVRKDGRGRWRGS